MAASTPPHEITRSQRWRERRTRFLLPDSVIDPTEFAVAEIPRRAARDFVEAHHYLGSSPPCRVAVGLFRNARPASRLVGVAMFTVPVQAAALPLHTGLPASAGVELGRLVLLDEVASNGETWMLRRAFAALRAARPAVEAVTAYSDPTPRFGPSGSQIHVGHVGHIYYAYAGPNSYRGQRPSRRVLMTPDGQVFPARTISKIRNGERGAAGGVDALVRKGAPPPKDHDLRGWFAGLAESGFLTARKAAGVHAYAFALTRTARRAAEALPRPPRPVRGPLDPRGDITGLPLFAR
ncbi:MAG: hypothetical protein WBL20_10860 [Sphingobium sp.]